MLIFYDDLTDEQTKKITYYLSKKWDLKANVDSDGDGLLDIYEVSESGAIDSSQTQAKANFEDESEVAESLNFGLDSGSEVLFTSNESNIETELKAGVVITSTILNIGDDSKRGRAKVRGEAQVKELKVKGTSEFVLEAEGIVNAEEKITIETGGLVKLRGKMVAPAISGDFTIENGGEVSVDIVTGNITMGEGLATLNVVIGNVGLDSGSELILEELNGDFTISNGGKATVDRVLGKVIMGNGTANIKEVIGDIDITDDGYATVDNVTGNVTMGLGQALFKTIFGSVNINENGVFKSENIEGNVEINSATAEVTLDNVTGNVNLISGINKPGQSPGTTTINGDYTQGTDATLDIEIAGVGSTEYDQLIVNDGDMNLGGTLNIILIDGFTVPDGGVFNILTVNNGSIIGEFDAIVLSDGFPTELTVITENLYVDGTISIQHEISDSNIQSAVDLWVSDQASAAIKYGQIGTWDTSAVTNMTSLFQSKTTFNEDIGGWDVSNVTNMSYMFYEAAAFNQDIGSWDVSKVTNMSYTFYEAAAFNQDVSSWDVSKVTNMSYMFYKATAFNYDLRKWAVGSSTNLTVMLSGMTAFNNNSEWNTNTGFSSTPTYEFFNNSEPIITGDVGTPVDSIDGGSNYNFTPNGVSDPNEDTLLFIITNQPSWASFNTASGALSGTPSNSDEGIYSGIIIDVTDNRGSTISVIPSFSITVVNINVAPTVSDINTTTDENNAAAIELIGSDTNGDSITYSIVTQPTNGTLTVSGASATYNPTANFVGTDSFTYKANDGYVDSDQNATVTITVNEADVDNDGINDIYDGFSITESDSTTVVSENGTDTFTVVLDAEPDSDVVIDLSTSDSTESSVSPSTLTLHQPIEYTSNRFSNRCE